MGTVVEPFILSLGDLQNDVEGNSRTSSIEVIDVDANEASASGSSLPIGGPRIRPAFRQRQPYAIQSEPETISLIDDSDDEVQILPDPNRGNGHEVHNRRQLRSPPPPPLDLEAIMDQAPPVPPVPPRFAGFTSFPIRRIPQHLPAPPVRANTQPFAFEHQLHQGQQPQAGPSNHQQAPHARGGGAAPPSHHTPAMGLGGALISSNNSRAQQEAAAARLAYLRSAQFRRRPNAWLNGDFEDILFRNPGEDQGPQIRRWFDTQQENLLRLYNRLRGRETPSPPKYQQSYTHPGQAEPGFTFDFAPNSSDEGSPRDRRFPATSANAPIIVDDDDEVSVTSVAGPSASSSSAAVPSSSPAIPKSANPAESGNLSILLVCARCLDPLLLNESLGPDDNGRRVWALRCGHMIDEKCLNEIGQPEEEPEPEVQVQLSVPDRKGKGKAKAKLGSSYGEAAVRGVDTANNSIRSRLRSAAASSDSGAAASSSSSSFRNSSSSSGRTHSALPPSKRRRIAVPVRKIEAEFEWTCPVSSCGLVHASVKIGGKWGPEQEGKLATTTSATTSAGMINSAKVRPRGAIPVFA